jgi:hypothetical protein
MTQLRVVLSGESAELGKVPAADVAKLLLGIERAVARSASVNLGRTAKPRGRRASAVAETARLRLRAIEPGSVVPVLELPDIPHEAEPLILGEPPPSENAVHKVFDALQDEPSHPSIINALVQLTEELGIGERYESLSLKLLNDEVEREVIVDASTRQRLRAQAGLPTPIREETVIGTLVEADFEKRSARLRSPDGQAVSVTFGEELADEIQEALRRQAGFIGQVVYDRDSMQARSVALHSIWRPEQLMLGVDVDAFWQVPSYEDLAEQQGAGLAPVDPDDLYDADATDEERDAILTAISTLYSEA